MKNLELAKLNDIICQWFDELVSTNKGITRKSVNSSDRLYELTGTFHGTDKKFGYVVKDKYYPNDRRLIHIFQCEYDNIRYIIEDGEKIYLNKQSKHSLFYPCENTKELSERIAEAFNLEYVKPIKSHIIDDYISTTSRDQRNVLHQITDFIVDKIIDNEYIIFQSNFGFMNTDVPFTLICKKYVTDGVIRYELDGNSQDWASFSIDDFHNDTILHEWEYHNALDIEEHPELKYLNAREIVESVYYTDSSYSFIHDTVSALTDDTNDILRKMLYDKIYGALFNEYYNDTECDYFADCIWYGRVAVIYTDDIND